MINKYLTVLTVTCIISINGISIFEAGPPKPTNHALVAREVLHSSAWVSLSTISTMPDIKSFPYAGLESIVDGIDEKGNGVPYFFVTALDQAILDIQADKRCSVMASMAQQDWCVKYNLDQEDPRCQRVVLTGNFVWLDNKTEEYTKANENMLRKHPQFKYWPNAHDFTLAKMDIKQITLFDWFGGIKTIDLKEYFNAYDSNEI
ncbi:hypothetical protein PPYR_06597 [Photinus pyralis]|uniref:CREG-like beta-barrel domain-containing protein n=1 Tax=Photinus pyralis TaxID=7054 RepID=A0A1Y1LTC7_PHOPY|nr:protein CREG1-like [Photinus pyralis]XP_031338327.1 protein CREG1-like [Photinus pyralis]XP_031338329.1 protein CREG1-like [Photinus pyralis]KAB0800682.1 hypothetical protein PPYR_06421 [Photinus pyralis]KAB0800685.1 hypothetical protein PPYR_06424 [Photinus pyralis]KAB0800858.1 hypothetical protein PPYR_06597 [Photinus pyralis]